MPEQRQAPRVETALSAVVTVGKRRVLFRIDDLSTSGARLSGALTLVLHERIGLSIVLEGAPIEVEAEVVRVHTADLVTDQAAVRFIDLPAHCRDALAQFVSTVLVGPDDERETARIQRI